VAEEQERIARRGHSTAEKVREILRKAVRDENGPKEPLGSRIAGRVASIGLEKDIPELRGEAPRAADFDA